MSKKHKEENKETLPKIDPKKVIIVEPKMICEGCGEQQCSCFNLFKWIKQVFN